MQIVTRFCVRNKYLEEILSARTRVGDGKLCLRNMKMGNSFMN